MNKIDNKCLFIVLKKNYMRVVQKLFYISLCLLLMGCYFRTMPNELAESEIEPSEGQVFAGDSLTVPVKITLVQSIGPVIREIDRYWIVDDKKITTSSAAKRINRFLEKERIERDILPVKSLNDDQIIYLKNHNYGIISYKMKDGIRVDATPDCAVTPRMTIVSIVPLVVIVEQNALSYYSKKPTDLCRPPLIWGCGGYSLADDDGKKKLIMKWDLPYGYEYGSDCWFDDDMQWFSPDLNVLPRDLEVVSNTEKRIKVPWGWLVFKYELINIEYPVYSSQKRQTETANYTGYHWRVYAEGPDYYE